MSVIRSFNTPQDLDDVRAILYLLHEGLADLAMVTDQG